MRGPAQGRAGTSVARFIHNSAYWPIFRPDLMTTSKGQSRALIQPVFWLFFVDASPHAATTLLQSPFFLNVPSADRAYGFPVYGFPMFFTVRLAPDADAILRELVFCAGGVYGKERMTENPCLERGVRSPFNLSFFVNIICPRLTRSGKIRNWRALPISAMTVSVVISVSAVVKNGETTVFSQLFVVSKKIILVISGG